jgi:ATP:ADP antiporter, AAA family
MASMPAAGVKVSPLPMPSLNPVPSLSAIPLVNSAVPSAAAAARSPSAEPLSAPLASLQTFSAALAPPEGEAPSPQAQRETSELHFSGASVRHEDSSLPVLAAPSESPRPTLSPSAPAPKPAPRASLLRRVSGVMKSDAGKLASAAFLWNFLTIGAYSIIGPARGALLLTKFGPETIPWVYLASAALTGAVVWVYNRASKSAGRGALIGGSLGLLALTLAGGALAVSALGSPAASFGYYLWTDVFGIMSVTLFWTYQNDVFKREEAKRLFGFVAAGAPLGSIAGAFLVKALVGSLGPVPMLLIAAGVFAAVLPIFFWMQRLAQGRSADAPQAAPGAAAPASEGVLKTILKSKFLLFLTALVALERLVPDITNYLYSVVAAQSFAGDPKGLAAFFADVNFWTAVASFAVSSILVGLTIKRLGTAGALMTAAVANLLLFALFPFAPSLALVGVFFGLDGVSRYTWFKTAKETTYSATDKDVIYRVKAFVEMFVYRFARGLAGFLLLAAAALGWGPAAVAWVGVPLALAWLYSAWRVGREHAGLDAAKKAAGK